MRPASIWTPTDPPPSNWSRLYTVITSPKHYWYAVAHWRNRVERASIRRRWARADNARPVGSVPQRFGSAHRSLNQIPARPKVEGTARTPTESAILRK